MEHKMINHYEMRYKNDYIAKLRVDGENCREVVFHKGYQIHSADFPTRYLGGGSRSEYLGCMVHSIAREFESKNCIS
jgi:hypothetical protein